MALSASAGERILQSIAARKAQTQAQKVLYERLGVKFAMQQQQQKADREAKMAATIMQQQQKRAEMLFNFEKDVTLKQMEIDADVRESALDREAELEKAKLTAASKNPPDTSIINEEESRSNVADILKRKSLTKEESEALSSGRDFFDSMQKWAGFSDKEKSKFGKTPEYALFKAVDDTRDKGENILGTDWFMPRNPATVDDYLSASNVNLDEYLGAEAKDAAYQNLSNTLTSGYFINMSPAQMQAATDSTLQNFDANTAAVLAGFQKQPEKSQESGEQGMSDDDLWEEYSK